MEYIKVIGFDWGNVLNNYHRHTELMAQRLGLSVKDFERAVSPHVRDFHLGLDEMEFWKRVCSYRVAKIPSKPIWNETAEAGGIKINEELFEVVRHLRDMDYGIAMISNAELPNVDYINGHIKGNPKYNLFHHYVLSSQIEHVKPDPEVLQYTCRLFGINPEIREQRKRLILIDDNPTNVKGALDFGSQAIHHVTNQETIKDLSNLLKVQFT